MSAPSCGPQAFDHRADEITCGWRDNSVATHLHLFASVAEHDVFGGERHAALDLRGFEHPELAFVDVVGGHDVRFGFACGAGAHRTCRRVGDEIAATGWAPITPCYAGTAHRYINQVTLSLRPNTVKHIEQDLRRFGSWLTDTHPEIANYAELQRIHIEEFKTWLSTTRPRAQGSR